MTFYCLHQLLLTSKCIFSLITSSLHLEGFWGLALELIYFSFACLFKSTDPAKIVKLVSERNVTAQTSIPLDCRAEGNPPPSYTWTPCESVCNESVLNFQASNNSIYVFTCEVENKLGSDTRNTTLCKLVREK